MLQLRFVVLPQWGGAGMMEKPVAPEWTRSEQQQWLAFGHPVLTLENKDTDK